MTGLTKIIRNFRDDESGNAAIEMLLCVPIMVWAMLSTMVYFDAYHDEAISTRAGLTIADMFSREDSAVDMDYMTGAVQVLRTLTETEADPDLRVTVYEYVEDEDKFRVVWSKNVGYDVDYNDATLALVRPGLPNMADGDTSILVETKTKYHAPFSVTISPFIVPDLDGIEFNSFTVISPRFLGSICWQESATSDADCTLSDL